MIPTATPKTIQIFLPGGDPQGIRVAEITTRIVQVIEVPRSLLPEFLKMPESAQVAVYFLTGESEGAEERRVYVGQTGDLPARLVFHHKEKDFWQKALVLISRTNSLTQTHGLFLEWRCLQAIRAAAPFTDENGNAGTKPHIPPPLEADCHEIFDTGRTLLATLGFPLFDPVAQPPALNGPEQIFLCKTSGVEARGLYTAEGFVVLKGSTARQENVKSIQGTSGARLRDKLLESGILRVKGNSETATFTKDHLFRSPSTAALAVLGRTANGWVEWRTPTGQTLDAARRQNIQTPLP